MSTDPDLEKKLDTIEGTVGFEFNSRREIVPLARLARWESYKRGDIIFNQGDEPDKAHFMESGRVKVFITSASGQSFTVLLAQAGYTLNSIACFNSLPRFFSAQAMDDVRVLVLPGQALVDFVLHQPVTAKSVLNIMGQLQLSAIHRIMDLIEEGVEQRIVNVLTLLNDRIGEKLPLTNTDLAELTGTTRETTTRVLSRLDDAGLIHRSRGLITIANPAELKELAGDRFFFI